MLNEHYICLKTTKLKVYSTVVLTELECVYEFEYLGNMLNDTGGVKQAVATRVRAA